MVNTDGNVCAREINNDKKRNYHEKIFLTDITFLKYITKGVPRTGMITVEFEYIILDSSITYLEVQYSDPELRRHAEVNSQG